MPKTTKTKEKKGEAIARKFADQIYAIGFRNGQIVMKNTVLKKINRDWSLAGSVAIKILKMVDELVPKKITKKKS